MSSAVTRVQIASRIYLTIAELYFMSVTSMSDTIRVQFALVCEKKIDKENMDEIHSFTTSPRPRIDIHVYFLQVCRPFSWNAVYLQRNVISRVIAIETPQV